MPEFGTRWSPGRGRKGESLGTLLNLHPSSKNATKRMSLTLCHTETTAAKLTPTPDADDDQDDTEGSSAS